MPLSGQLHMPTPRGQMRGTLSGHGIPVEGTADRMHTEG